ncbi:hypothetical protein GS503_14215 [Rhodococcus hoagii]|nr:hypothetical protein [Prescottella equi]
MYLCKTLLQDERRCALRHELFHVLRGAPSVEDDWLEQKEERIVDRLAARSLIRSSDFVDALVWCGNRVGPECAAELWVDIDTLLTWVRTLTPKEVDEIEAELARRA